MKKVSIIVPVFNGETSINACIESLLKQDYPKDKVEIVIVDNGSTDKTCDLVRNYPVTLIKENKKKGSYAARNKGIRSATGEILAFTDADCIADTAWVSKAVEAFTDEKVGCVAGSICSGETFNAVQLFLAMKQTLSQDGTMNHFFMSYPQTANAFYEKKIFDLIGLFEENWVSGGDADLAWRMKIETDYQIRYVGVAMIYHMHRTNVKALFNQRIKWQP